MARHSLPVVLVALMGCQAMDDHPELPMDAFSAPSEVKVTGDVDLLPPPPYDLSLTVEGLAVGEYVGLHASGADPGDNIVFLKGTDEGLTCPASFAPLCVDLANPSMAYRGRSAETADDAGEASVYYAIPTNEDLIGRRIAFQAMTWSPVTRLSNVVVGDVSAGAPCYPDIFEPNESFDEALPLAQGTYRDLSLCTGSLEDWYQIHLEEGDTLNWDVRFPHSEGDIDIQLLDASGALISYSISIDDDESISVVALDTTDAFMVVYMYEDAGLEQQGNLYDMTMSIVPGSIIVCEDDAYEDNDTPGTAFDLTAEITGGGATDAFTDLFSCEGDGIANYDAYSLNLAPGETINVFLEFADIEGDIDVTLLNLAGDVLDSSASVTDNEWVTYTNTGFFDETVIIREELFGETPDEPGGIIFGNMYDMYITVGTNPILDTSFDGAGYEVHDGEQMWFALVDTDLGFATILDGRLVGPDGNVSVSFVDSMSPGGNYEWHTWADVDRDGFCDPAVDHTWSTSIGTAERDAAIVRDHDMEFTDVCGSFPYYYPYYY